MVFDLTKRGTNDANIPAIQLCVYMYMFDVIIQHQKNNHMKLTQSGQPRQAREALTFEQSRQARPHL
ncbi:hypothetical protein L917_07099, partial [Phytophthora nicotianae]